MDVKMTLTMTPDVAEALADAIEAGVFSGAGDWSASSAAGEITLIALQARNLAHAARRTPKPAKPAGALDWVRWIGPEGFGHAA